MCSLVLTGCSVARKPELAAPAPEVVPVPPPSVDTTDAIPRREPRSAHGNPPFYKVLGKRYTVLASEEGYLERGVASWYGPTFHGESTSNGEKYNMYGMTAAHKTLPLPCYARVTNLKNGKAIVVRINDRGPFVSNRLIDLSYSAALKLDMLKEGTTLVEVRALTVQEPDNLTRSARDAAARPVCPGGCVRRSNQCTAGVEPPESRRLIQRLYSFTARWATAALPGAPGPDQLGARV